MCELQVCRVCLNTAVRGYQLQEYNLRICYENILSEKLCDKDNLPQWVCYECGTLLHKFHKFKEKCVRGQDLLKNLSFKQNVTYDLVSTIDRCSEDLISSLDIAKANKNVQTITIKHKHRNNSSDVQESKLNPEKLSQNVNLKPFKISMFDVTNNTIHDLETYEHENIDDFYQSMGRDDEELIKQESLDEDIVVSAIEISSEPIKSEINLADDLSINKMQNEDTEKSKYYLNNYIENDSYVLNPIFEIVNVKSSDDECLFDIAKKRRKSTQTTAKRKSKTKSYKPNYKKNEEVVLKNTKPRKLVLNPQFWKKTNLTEEEAIKEFKQREFNNSYYLKAKYKCRDCFKGFSKSEMLERHLKQRHDENIGDIECRFCHMRFRHKHQLVKHIKEHLILYNCLLCKLQCSRMSTAITHQEHHKGIKKICKHCGKEFNHLSTYYTHVRMSHRSAHVCVACGASFVSDHGLLLHTKFMHIDSLKQLEVTIQKRRDEDKGSSVPNNSTSVSGDTEEIYCAKCDIRFMSRRAYDTHFLKSDNHDDGDASAAAGNISRPGSNSRAKIPSTCPHCNENFPTRVAYKKHHLAEHPDIPLLIPKKREICEVCGASVQMGSIQYHMKSHTGERDFVCPAPGCDMRFTLKRNMKRHYNVKHLGMPSPKYIRRNPVKRKKKTPEILENDFSPFIRSRAGYFL